MDNTLSADASSGNPYEAFVPDEELHQTINWTTPIHILILACVYVCYPLYYLWYFSSLWRSLDYHLGFCSWCLQVFLIYKCYTTWNQDKFIELVRKIGMFFLQTCDIC